MGRQISRRRFLYTGAAAAATAALAACQPQTVIVEQEKIVKQTVEVEKEVEKVVKETVIVEKEKEVTKVVEKEVVKEVAKISPRQAPVLQELEKTGHIPPVEERLPLDPLVITPVEKIGQYGGTMRTVTNGTSFYDTDQVPAESQQLLRIDPELRNAVPNLLSAWEVSPDYTTFTCYLRKGLKFSDGEPATADDIMFWYEDVILNKELTAAVNVMLRPGGEPLEVEKIDDYTLRITFAVPHPHFPLATLAHRVGMRPDEPVVPAHYLQEFHIEYNAEADALAVKEGFEHWYQLYGKRRKADLNPDLPALRAFVPANETTDTVYLGRNAYFWMVDPEGNQLPYIDEIATGRIAGLGMYNAKIVAGEVDFAAFNTTIQNYSAYQDAAEKGDYRILLWKSGKGAEVWYQVNLACKDPVKREIFQDDRFRQALSLAIDRDEINSVIYFGRATPRQMTVLPTSRYFKQEYAESYADNDPDRASALLDEMGLNWDADNKNRLQPDGQPLIINWSIYESETPKGPITELVNEYWANIGVVTNYKSITNKLLNTQIQSNEYEMCLWHGDAVSDVLLATTQSDKWLVGGNNSNGYAAMWKLWMASKGEQGEEPPNWFKDLWDTKREFERAYDPELMHKVLSTQAERVFTIGTVGNAPHPVIASTRLRNVIEEGFWTWDSLFGAPYFAPQWFLEQT